jgi:hypothetical protein
VPGSVKGRDPPNLAGQQARNPDGKDAPIPAALWGLSNR